MTTLICTIDLDKEKGVTVTVEDVDGKLSQRITLDGKSITLEVKSSEDTSTIVQKPESVTVTCKSFVVDAETVEVKSKKSSEWKSEDTLKLESGKDMELTAGAKLTQKASQDAKLSSSANVSVEATQGLTLKGMKGQLAATGGELKVEALTLKMSAQSQAELAAPLIKVAAQGQLGLESSGMAELKGSITSVSGSLVKLG